VLGDRVGEALRRRRAAPDGRDIDNRARTLGADALARLERVQEHAAQVHIHGPVPVGRHHLEGGLVVGDAGIVDQDADADHGGESR
jgi:hypothetical protein